MDALAFEIGRGDAQVSVRANRREHAGASDYWDGNWIAATIAIAAGAFRGELEASLRAEDFVRFRDRLRPLHETLVGKARFDTMERWLAIDVEGDGKGHFHAECTAGGLADSDAQLTFAIDFDQTDLPEILAGLDAITRAFPVFGSP